MPQELSTRHISPWTTRDKIARILWATAENTVFKLSFHNAYRWRAAILRLFGAKIGKNLRIRRTAHIEIPWNLHIGKDVTIGDRAILYALGPIHIGDRCFISQYSHLCAGTHDHTSTEYPLLRLPITIGKDCWIAADVFISSNVTIGEGTLVGARSSVFSNLPPWVIAFGNPAKPVRPRILKNASGELLSPPLA